MILFQATIQLDKHHRGAYDITQLVTDTIKESKVHKGTCHLFIQSSSSALIVRDTADENTKNKTADFMADLAPDTTSPTREIEEMMTNMPENMRIATSRNEITIPVSHSRPSIGIWQGIFYWEEEPTPVERKLTFTIQGEPQHRSFRLSLD